MLMVGLNYINAKKGKILFGYVFMLGFTEIWTGIMYCCN